MKGGGSASGRPDRAATAEVLRDAVAPDRFRWFFGALLEPPESLSPGCWRLLAPVERAAWVGAQLQARPDQRHVCRVIGGNRVGSKYMMELGFPWRDSTRITVAGRPLWLEGKSWHRIGDRVLQERR